MIEMPRLETNEIAARTTSGGPAARMRPSTRVRYGMAGTRRASTSGAQDLEVHALGRRRGIHAELFGQDLPAARVHAERLRTVSGKGVRPHQPLIPRLAERLEVDDLV